MAQLPLPLRLSRHATFASFVAGANAAVVEHIRAVALGERKDSIWLAGPAGTGKSHLLASACRAAGDAGLRPIYLALDPAADPGLLSELDGMDLIALDDVTRVAGRADWERALFTVMDARLGRGGLLAAAGAVPRESAFALPDLSSRAGAMTVYRLAEPGDDDLLAATRMQAELRGLVLDAATAGYLLQRVSRDLGTLIDWLDRIDRFSLAAQRRITIPLVRRVLEEADAARG
jgi:DnaA family protein